MSKEKVIWKVFDLRLGNPECQRVEKKMHLFFPLVSYLIFKSIRFLIIWSSNLGRSSFKPKWEYFWIIKWRNEMLDFIFSPNRMHINFYFLVSEVSNCKFTIFYACTKIEKLKDEFHWYNFNFALALWDLLPLVWFSWFLFLMFIELMSMSCNWTVDGIAVYLNFWKMKMLRPILMPEKNSELSREMIVILIGRMFW